MFDNVGKGRWAEFNGDVKKIRLSLLVEVPDDVGMVVGFLEDADLAGGQCGNLLDETFDGDGTALERTLENHSSVGTET